MSLVFETSVPPLQGHSMLCRYQEGFGLEVKLSSNIQGMLQLNYCRLSLGWRRSVSEKRFCRLWAALDRVWYLAVKQAWAWTTVVAIQKKISARADFGNQSEHLQLLFILWLVTTQCRDTYFLTV